MKVLVATGGWKEGPSATKICELVERGFRQTLMPSDGLQVDLCPLADGGTGLADCAASARGKSRAEVTVSGPRTPQKVEAHYVTLDDGTCVFESATAAGLALLDRTQRSPLHTSTYGVGEVLSHAYNAGARRFIIGCGDSATNDCGIGFASALGVRFIDKFGDDVPARGQHLIDIDRFEIPDATARLIDDCQIRVACNPNSILCGPLGTTRRYGPQKGASPDDVTTLEHGVEHLTKLLSIHCGFELAYLPGGGGAGGLAGMIYALFGGHLSFSFDVLCEFVNLDQYFNSADLVVVTEGLLDQATLSGKLPCSVALYAKRHDCLVAAIAGGLADDMELLYYNGFDIVEVATKRPCNVEQAIAQVHVWLPDAASRLLRKLMIPKLRTS